MAKDLLKLHLYVVEVHGRTYRVLKLRPTEKIRFSNNFYHETWHLLTDPGGAEILAQLLWGLAFQKKEGTLLLVDDDHLVSTPFEADKPKPFVVVPAGLTPTDGDTLRALLRKVALMKAPTTTVKWRSFGLEKRDEFYDKVHSLDEEFRPLWAQEKMSLRGGVICYTAPSIILQMQALSVQRLSLHMFWGSNYTYLAEGDWRFSHQADGEVQIFADFEDRVVAASLAREQVLENPRAGIPDYSTREKIWNKTEKLNSARLKARKGKSHREPQSTEVSEEAA